MIRYNDYYKFILVFKKSVTAYSRVSYTYIGEKAFFSSISNISKVFKRAI